MHHFSTRIPTKATALPTGPAERKAVSEGRLRNRTRHTVERRRRRSAPQWVLHRNPTAGGALVATTDVAYNAMLSIPIVLTPGDIVLDVTGTEAGEIEWWVWYVPLDEGASITAV